jgi:geranylgeranyl reductase family protein
VVGAGPAGLSAARLLAEEGFDVAVLEEHASLGAPAHCTGVISDEVWGLFKVPDSLVLGRPSSCVVVAPSGRAVRLSGSDEGIAVIDRAQFDAELGAAALRAGAEIRTGFHVDRVRVDSRRAVAVGPAGEGVTARVAILASGVSYGLSRGLGLGLPSMFLHSAQLEVGARSAPSAVELHLGQERAPGGFAWLVPIVRDGGPRVRVGLMAQGDAERRLRGFLASPHVAGQLAEAPGAAIRRLLPLGPIEKTYGERVLAVGDAAGLTKPTTGGGIFYSLLSGALAAETLVEALRRDRLEAAALRAYERRWRARLDAHLRISGYLRRIFVRLADAEIDALVAAIDTDDLQEVIRRTAHFNWHGDVIRSLLRRPGISSLLLSTLLR